MRIRIVNQRHSKAGEYIGRPSPLGNPFTHLHSTQAQIVVASREEAIAQYRGWLAAQIQAKNPAVLGELYRLADIAESTGVLVLRCWCTPLACHGDVIKAVLEEALANRRR